MKIIRTNHSSPIQLKDSSKQFHSQTYLQQPYDSLCRSSRNSALHRRTEPRYGKYRDHSYRTERAIRYRRPTFLYSQCYLAHLKFHCLNILQINLLVIVFPYVYRFTL